MKKRKDGRYCKVITDTRTGKKLPPFYGKTIAEVNRKVLEYKQRQENGRRLSEVASDWWEQEVENLSPSTVRGYEAATRRVVDHLGDYYVKLLTTADVTKFLFELKKQGFAKKTVKNHKIVVNRILHFAVLLGEIPFNPAREAELPRGLPEKKRLPATPEEERYIRSAVEHIWLLPFMALLTGMRKGELIGLKWKDIDMVAGLIHVERSVWYERGGTKGAHIKCPKTEAGKRTIPLLEPLRVELEKYTRIPEHYVFGDENPITEKKYTVMYNKFKEQTGVQATAQQLRKSYATLAVGAAVPPDVLRVIFGHADISTTLNLYAAVREERIIAAAAQLEATDLIKS